MTREEFLLKMQDVLQRDDILSFDMNLADVDEWDSLSKMATMAFWRKNLDVKTRFADYKEMKTVEDIALKADCKYDFF